MDVNELSAQIQDKYRVEVARFREKILGPEGLTNAETMENKDRKAPALGPVRSTDRHVDLTMVGDCAELGWFAEDPSLAGYVVTVSFAGHHRTMGTRTSLPSGECDAWVQAILGLDWVDHVYRAGTLSGLGRLSTVYYRLFLDESFTPVVMPESFKEKNLRKWSEL